MFDPLVYLWQFGDARHAVLIVGLALTVWAAATDLRHFTIPNKISAALFAAGAVWILISGADPGAHLAAFACVLALGFLAYAFQFFGAGDAKLLAVLALWTGPQIAVALVLQTLIFGAILAFAWVLSRPVRTVLMAAGLPVDPEPPAQIPYGVAIAAAACFAFAGLWPPLGG